MAKKTKDPASEFQFVRDKIETISRLLLNDGVGSSLLEVAFMLGCLQNICHENWMFFKKDDDSI